MSCQSANFLKINMSKDSVFACILDEQGKIFFEKRYGTLTPNLTLLRDTLVEKGCWRVALAFLCKNTETGVNYQCVTKYDMGKLGNL